MTQFEISTLAVLSAIGVIEHLREPHRLLEAFRKSKLKYLFYSVPMFSVSAILENVFPGTFPRQLSGAHTHLFTERSIEWMYANEGLLPVAEWRFGTDLMDLYRIVNVELARNGASHKLQRMFEQGFATKIDELQSILDRNHFCSEIHCLVEKA